MMKLLEDLADILAEEVACVRRLLPALEEQERVLLRADAVALVDLVGRQQALMATLGELECARRAAVGRLARHFDVQRERLTFSALRACVREMPERLATVRDDLREALAALATRNRRNGFLLERSLGHVERLFAHLLPVAAPVPMYAASGRATHTSPALARLDRQA